MVSIALKAVSNELFPHRALINQVAWMKRRMRKPASMSVREFVASATQMNGKLIRFPGATEPPELLELLEFALQDAWRAKFDLKKGYIPTDHDKTRLVLEGEQIERAAALSKAAAVKPKQHHSTAAGKTGSNRNKVRKGKPNGAASASSPAVKHKTPGKGDSVGKSFSGNKFRKELYAVSKNKDRLKVIDQYSAVLEKERKKTVRRNAAVKKAKKIKEEPETSSSGESDDESVHVMDTEETDNERKEYVKHRLRATMRRIKKRQVHTYNVNLYAGLYQLKLGVCVPAQASEKARTR